MLRLFFDRSQRVLLSVLVAGPLLLALTLVAGAQPSPNITITPNVKEAQPSDSVTFKLVYTLPGGSDPSTPGAMTTTWSANGSLMNASDGHIEDKGGVGIRWNYPKGLPRSNELPSFTLQVGDSSDPIVVTTTLIVSDSQDLKQIQQQVSSTVNIPVVSVDDSMVAVLTESSLEIGPTETVTAGTSFTVTVAVSNTGRALAENVTVVLTPTIALQNIAISPPNDVRQLGEGTVAFRLLTPVEIGQQGVVHISAVVPPDATGKLGITGLITATGGIKQTLSSQVDITPPPIARLVVQIKGPESLASDEALNLSLWISNEGEVAAKDIKISVSTTPEVKLTTSSSEEIDASNDGSKLVIVLASLEPGKNTQIRLTGETPVDHGDFSVSAEVLDSDRFESGSQLRDSHHLAVQPSTAPPTLTAKTIVTPTTSVTPPAGAASTTDGTPPAGDPTPAATTSGADDSLPVPILGLAFLTALVAGVMLLFLLRGRRKPRASPPSAPGPSPVSPGSGLVTAPLPTSSASLEFVALPGMRIALKPDVTTIGRAPDSIIRIDEHTMNWETVSRTHAEIRREGGDYVIYDVCPDRRSSNGVFVEGRRTVRNVLRPGWRIGIGAVELIFRDTAAEEQ